MPDIETVWGIHASDQAADAESSETDEDLEARAAMAEIRGQQAEGPEADPGQGRLAERQGKSSALFDTI